MKTQRKAQNMLEMQKKPNKSGICPKFLGNIQLAIREPVMVASRYLWTSIYELFVASELNSEGIHQSSDL